MAVRSAAPRMLRLPHAPRLRRPSLRVLAGLVLAAALLVAGWYWLRDSSLVRVEHVTVTGAHGFGAAGVRSALDAAARDMTTLHVDEGALRAAVASFPLVKGLQVHASPPHGLTIAVQERIPVGVLVAGTQEVTVADDGTLLRAVPTSGLPVIPVKAPPGGSRVADRPTQAKVAVLAAAPASLRSRVTKVVLGPHGLTVDLGSGPQLRFGDGRRLHAKWLAAARVMSDPGAADATYIDVRVPERPAAGGLSLAQGGAPEAQPQASSDPAAAAGTAATGAPGAGVGASGALGTATTTASAPSAGQGTVTTAPAAGAPGAVTTTPAAVSGGATAPAASAP